MQGRREERGCLWQNFSLLCRKGRQEPAGCLLSPKYQSAPLLHARNAQSPLMQRGGKFVGHQLRPGAGPTRVKAQAGSSQSCSSSNRQSSCSPWLVWGWESYTQGRGVPQNPITYALAPNIHFQPSRPCDAENKRHAIIRRKLVISLLIWRAF